MRYVLIIKNGILRNIIDLNATGPLSDWTMILIKGTGYIS